MEITDKLIKTLMETRPSNEWETLIPHLGSELRRILKIREDIASRNRDTAQLKEAYEKQRKFNDDAILRIQQACKHESTSERGNVEDGKYTECNICGAMW